MTIDEWFNSDLNYDAGLSIYRSLPNCKASSLWSLEKGKNNYNMSFLIKELRAAKNEIIIVQEKKPKELEVLPPAPTDAQIDTFHENEKLKETSKKVEFGSVRYGELPVNLRVRYLEAASLFYKICDLKLELNNLFPGEVAQALDLQLLIEDLDIQRENIWTELHHWQNHKIELPTEPDPFEGKTPVELYKIRLNTKTHISKLTKRLDGYFAQLESTTDKQSLLKLERQIERSEKTLHKHKLNLDKINSLI